MAESGAERQQAWRDRQRGGPPRKPQCGLPGPAGAKRHQRNGEPVCDACAEARRVYNRNKQREHRAKQAPQMHPDGLGGYYYYDTDPL